MINKIDKTLARLTKNKIERSQINKMISKKGGISTDTVEIQKKIIKEYYEQLYANKLDNLEEMDKFPETYSPPKLNKRGIDNLNRPISRNERGSVI